MTLPRTGLGTTSLGAVGGPRGTAAGALRIAVEFLTTYDASAVRQLESDLASLATQIQALGNAEAQATARVAEARSRLARQEANFRAQIGARRVAGETTSATRARAIGRGFLDEFAATRTVAQENAVRAQLRAARDIGNISAREYQTLVRIARLRKQITTLTQSQASAQQRLAAATDQQAIKEKSLSQFKAIAAQVPQRLAGLAIGAIGGLVGGAIFGAGFALAQGVIDQIGEGLQDIFDPARHAREEIKGVADEVSRLAADQNITKLAAIKQLLRDMGVSADDGSAKLILMTAAISKFNEETDKRKALLDIENHGTLDWNKAIAERAKLLIAEGYRTGETTRVLVGYANTGRSMAPIYQEQVRGLSATKIAEQQLREELVLLNHTEEDAARVKARDAAAAYALAAALREARQAADAYVRAQQGGLDAQIDAIRGADNRSDKTKALEAAIQKLQGGSGSTRKALADLEEQRQLILLRQRLRLMGTEIDLSKYSGKFLLAAIDAKIAALNKQAAAQDRLNKLMDLQLRISKGIRRETGESINDFLERRAKENRDILNEQAAIAREAQIAELQDLRDKTQDEVDLAELAERRKEILAQAGRDARLKILQQQLEDSKKADQAATQAKIDELEKQKKALQDAADAAFESASKEHLDEFNSYVKVAGKIKDLSKISGEVRGLVAAQAFFQALLDSGVLTGTQYRSVLTLLNNVKASIQKYDNQWDRLGSTTLKGKNGGPVAFASGGLIPLNNARNPFGGNFQFGEEGTEFAMVFSREMSKKFGMGRQAGGSTINMYSSNDPYRDAYRIRQIVREEVRSELRG